MKPGNDRVQRPLARRERVRMRRVEREEAAAVLQREPAPSGTTPEPKLAKLLWMSETMLPSRSTTLR